MHRRRTHTALAFAAATALLAAGVGLVAPGVAHARQLVGPRGGDNKLPTQLKGVTVKERLGKTIDLDLAFVDHRGKRVKLRDYVADGKPMLLTLNYYACKVLCTLQLNAVARALSKLDLVPGEKFNVVTVSFDPRDTVAIARGKRDNLLEVVRGGGADKKGKSAQARRAKMAKAQWHLMVASAKPSKSGTARPANVHELAKQVGFQYRFIQKTNQFAHAAAIYLISPEGKISRYLYGLTYNPRDLKFALMDASKGKIGTTVERVLLSCFHYDPSSGSYSAFAFGIMRLGGAISAVVLAIVLLVLWRRGRSRDQRLAAEQNVSEKLANQRNARTGAGASGAAFPQNMPAAAGHERARTRT